jgi:predicted alpha/beta hydrolase family esterase
LFKFFIFFFIFFSFQSKAFNPGKESQFIGATILDSPTGKASLNISDTSQVIILIYNQGWGEDTSKSKYIRGKDNCFVDYYLENQKNYKLGKLGPWYSLASEYRYLIQDKTIMLYYFCKNRAHEGLAADGLRSMLANNLVKLVDAFVKNGVPRNQIIPLGHSGGATVVIEAMVKKPDKIKSVIATSWSVAGEKPWKAIDSGETKRFAARYKKNDDSLKALVYACNQDEFTSYKEQVFWKEVKGVELIELEGGHICWFNLFNDHQEILRVLEFIQSGLE